MIMVIQYSKILIFILAFLSCTPVSFDDYSGEYEWIASDSESPVQYYRLSLNRDSTFSFYGISLNSKENIDPLIWVPYHYWLYRGKWSIKGRELCLSENEDIDELLITFPNNELEELNQILPSYYEEKIKSMKGRKIIFKIDQNTLIYQDSGERLTPH